LQKHLNPLYFVCITQAGLLFAVPFLTARRVSRHDFAILLSARQNWSKLALLFVIGCSGLALYNLGLAADLMDWYEAPGHSERPAGVDVKRTLRHTYLDVAVGASTTLADLFE